MPTLTLPRKKIADRKAYEKQAKIGIAREERITKATEWLLTNYPAFQQILPLAIGVRQITAANCPTHITRNTLSLARDRWCNSPRYLARLAAPDSIRHNLDGSVAGPVSDEHRERAAKLLADL